MKKLNEQYKRLLKIELLKESPWDPGPGVDTPDGGVYKPNYTTPVQQDVIVPNAPEQYTPDSPPGWDNRFRDRELPEKPWKPNPFNRGWDPWPPGQPTAPGMWPRPFGRPFPRNPPPGWPNNKPWPPPPGDPFYQLVYDFYTQNPHLIHGGYGWSGQGWENMPAGLREKIVKEYVTGIQLLQADPENPMNDYLTLGFWDLVWIFLAITDPWLIPAEIYNYLNPEATAEHEAEVFTWQYGNPMDPNLGIYPDQHTQPQHYQFPWEVIPDNLPNGTPIGWHLNDDGNWVWTPSPTNIPSFAWDYSTNPPRLVYRPRWDGLSQQWVIPGPGGNGWYYYNPDDNRWVPTPRGWTPPQEPLPYDWPGW